MAGVRNIKSRAEFDQLVKENPKVALQATAVWCGPCKAISPIFQKFATEHESAGDYAFAKFFIDGEATDDDATVKELESLAQDLGISAVPTFFFFQDGEKALIEVKGKGKGGELRGPTPPQLKEAVEGLKAYGTLSTDEDF